MPYSIGLYFDPETDHTVREIWRRLAEDGLADYYPVSGNRPHITLVLFDDTDVGRAESVLREAAESQPAFSLSFQQGGCLPRVKAGRVLGACDHPDFIGLAKAAL